MIDEKTPLTPNLKSLLIRFIVMESVPNGGGFAAAMNSISSKERIIENARKGMAQLNLALEAIKAAPDNPYGTDDETIAGVILKSLEDVEKKRTNHGSKI